MMPQTGNGGAQSLIAAIGGFVYGGERTANHESSDDNEGLFIGTSLLLIAHCQHRPKGRANRAGSEIGSRDPLLFFLLVSDKLPPVSQSALLAWRPFPQPPFSRT